MKKFVIGLLLTFRTIALADVGVLYWQSGGNPVFDGDTSNLAEPMLDGIPLSTIINIGDDAYGICVRVLGPNVASDTFLGFLFDDGTVYPGETGAWIGHDVNPETGDLTPYVHPDPDGWIQDFFWRVRNRYKYVTNRRCSKYFCCRISNVCQ